MLMCVGSGCVGASRGLEMCGSEPSMFPHLTPAGKLSAGMDWTQVFKCSQLIGGVCGFQTTLAQLASMCKGRCMCFPLHNLIVGFDKESVGVAEPLYVSFDTPIFELSHSLDEVVIYGGRPQEDGFEP